MPSPAAPTTPKAKGTTQTSPSSTPPSLRSAAPKPPTKTTIVKGPKADLLNHIKSTVDFNEPVVKALQELDSKGIHANKWERSEGIVLHHGRVYVP